MRWLLIVLLVSLAGLLFAAVAAARHISQQRRQNSLKRAPGAAKSLKTNGETDPETEL